MERRPGRLARESPGLQCRCSCVVVFELGARSLLQATLSPYDSLGRRSCRRSQNVWTLTPPQERVRSQAFRRKFVSAFASSTPRYKLPPKGRTTKPFTANYLKKPSCKPPS